MRRRCPSSVAVGIAELREHGLVFPRFSLNRQCAVAGFRPACDRSVWGVLYRLTPDDWQSLDEKEGCRRDRDFSANSYNRAPITVWQGTAAITCLAYEALPHDDPGLPSREYIDVIVNGARHHALPSDYIRWLKRLPVQGSPQRRLAASV
jgi:hypothetical protein